MRLEALQDVDLPYAHGIAHLTKGERFRTYDDEGSVLQRKAPHLVKMVVDHVDLDTYCPICRGGYWIRPAHGEPLQCGHCYPVSIRVETVYTPGGSPPTVAQPPVIQAPEGLVREPALKADSTSLTPVYWQRLDGSISGPANVESFFRLDDSDGLIVTHEEKLYWINASLLRSRNDFERQRPVIEVDRELLKA